MVTVNVGCSELVLYWEEADVLNSDHGTGTSLPLELRFMLLSVVVVEELELFIELSDVLLELSESNAKSTRPEDGLMITSCTVPTRWPEESLTCAPVSLLARTVLSLSRPVALRCLVLQLRFAEEESLEGWSCDCDCAHADAASIEQAAHTAVIRENFFVITSCSFVLCSSFRKKIDTAKRRFETNKVRTTLERLKWGLDLTEDSRALQSSETHCRSTFNISAKSFGNGASKCTCLPERG
jgi:hypothetical protein